MSLRKIARQEAAKENKKITQNTTQAPIPVRIVEFFPDDSLVTVQLTTGGEFEFGGITIEGVKFPLAYPPHESVSKGIEPGTTPGMLHLVGWQLKKGFVTIGHSPNKSGTKVATYAPIRYGWAVS